jgi:hypothetical protein
MTSTTRAALERLIETERHNYPWLCGQLAALLTAEGPAPETPIHCTVVELNGKTLAAPCAIEERCMYPDPPSREALAVRLTEAVLLQSIEKSWGEREWAEVMRAVLLDALCPQEPT